MSMDPSAAGSIGQLTHPRAGFTAERRVVFALRRAADAIMSVVIDERLDIGRAALREGRWEDAREAFEALIAERDTPEALDGLGEAMWWLCDARSSVRYRERAFVGYRHEGNAARACRTAVDLSITYLVNLGNDAAARGWLARAERVMENTDANPLQGWLWLMRGYLGGDSEPLELLRRAVEFARRTADIDLELVALSDLGYALVLAGNADEGMTMLDEAMAATLGGEYTRLDTVVYTSCNMLAACSVVGDLQRASQWCRVADDFMRDYSCPFLFARCRVHYGSVLLAKGHWQRAEDELQAALQMSEDAGPGLKEEALARLADLRFRQGRLEEAEAFVAASDDPTTAAVSAAAVRLARGEARAAATILERRLKAIGDGHAEATPTLAMLVDAYIESGDLDAADETAGRVEAIARAQRGDQAGALSRVAHAKVLLARESPDDAIDQFERALEVFSRLDLPLETARVRLDLARAYVERAPELAVTETTKALSTFEHLGATTDVDAAFSLLRSLGARARTGPKDVGVLTNREREVLRLVGLGLSNPEIAQRLFISRKTAAHHVSNLLAKLGLRNRAEAVAYETRTLSTREADLAE